MACASGMPQLYGPPPPAYGPPAVIDPILPPHYNFNYGVADDHYGPVFSHNENRDDYNTAGEYRVNLPDGRVQIVSYHADQGGYTADVKYEGEAQYPAEVKPSYAPAPAYAPAPVYAPAPAYAPAPVVYTPAPTPAPVVYTPAPVVYRPAPVYPQPAPYRQRTYGFRAIAEVAPVVAVRAEEATPAEAAPAEAAPAEAAPAEEAAPASE